MSKNEARIKRELEKMMKQPPAGISLCMINDNISELRATIMGVPGTPYESGLFVLDVILNDKYPHEPPNVRFKTPVYHPNIDESGRICLELLKGQPSGCWRPVITIEAVLLSIQSLLGSPNPDDPLMENIAQEYRLDRQEFENKAREYTLKHASQNQLTPGSSSKSKNSQDCSSEDSIPACNMSTKRKSSDGGSDAESTKKFKGNVEEKDL